MDLDKYTALCLRLISNRTWLFRVGNSGICFQKGIQQAVEIDNGENEVQYWHSEKTTYDQSCIRWKSMGFPWYMYVVYYEEYPCSKALSLQFSRHAPISDLHIIVPVVSSQFHHVVQVILKYVVLELIAFCIVYRNIEVLIEEVKTLEPKYCVLLTVQVWFALEQQC